ncbi:MAG: hypothetical protein JW795_04835 [Chitinivibrionales bacterium]|nr:hypothetical protein [Chitinivibrionales bacterium]
MSKSKKKQKKKNFHNPNNRNSVQELTQNDLEQLELKGRTFFEQGMFAESRDIYKQLVRRDSRQYTPLLAACYRSIFMQQLEKKAFSDARSTLFLLRQLIGDEQAHPETVLLQLKEKRVSASPVACIELLTSHRKETAASIKPGQTPDIHIQVIDSLVLSFTIHPELEKADRQLATEIALIQDAIRRICDRDYQAALNTVQSIGFRSSVAHWRLFIKGLCAYFQSDDEKVGEAFGKIPATSLLSQPVRVIRATLKLNETCADHFKDQQLLKNICRFLGRQEYQDILPRAEYLWHIGRKKDSYLHIRSSVRNFPDLKEPLLQSLSFFYFNAAYAVDSHMLQSYLDDLFEILMYKGAKNRCEEFLFARTEALFSSFEFLDDEAIEDIWIEYKRAYGIFLGVDASTTAFFDCKIASLLIESNTRSLPTGRSPKRLTGAVTSKALKYMTKAFESSPLDANIYMKALELFERCGEIGKRDTVLETLMRLDCRDKSILLKAGARAIEKKQFPTGIEYLRRAAAEDPLDQTIKLRLVQGYISYGVENARRAKPALFRPLLQEALALVNPSSKEILYGHACLSVHWAAMECIAGNAAEGRRLLEKASGQCGETETGMAYFIHLVFTAYDVPHFCCIPYMDKVTDTFSRKPNVSTALQLFPLLQYMLSQQQHREETKMFTLLDAEVSRFSWYLKSVFESKEEFAALLPLIRQFIDCTPLHGSAVLRALRSRSSATAKKKPSDYFAAFAALWALSQSEKRRPSRSVIASRHQKLEWMLEAAQSADDRWVVQQVQRMLQKLQQLEAQKLLPPPPSRLPFPVPDEFLQLYNSLGKSEQQEFDKIFKRKLNRKFEGLLGSGIDPDPLIADIFQGLHTPSKKRK